jgi:putative RecB family exonuclease
MSIGLFDQDAVDDRGTDVWQYVSASRLNCWLRCPLAFKLRYIDGIRPPPTPALFVGKMVHAALECFYRHRQLGLTIGADELQRRFAESWGGAVAAGEVAFDSVADEEACRRQVSSLADAYLAKVGGTEPRPLAVEASVETPLVDPSTGEDLGIPLLGVMDLVLPDETGPVIADFKTAAKSSEPLEISHEIQLCCYAYLFRQASPVREAGLEIRSLVKTKTPQVHFHRYPSRDE